MMANDPLNLGENGEWAGMWWLPDAPEQQVPGVLRYNSNDGLSLTLIGAFEDRIMSNPAPGKTVFHKGRRTWDVVHGAAEQREITLLDCYPTSSNRTIGARVRTSDKQTIEAITAAAKTGQIGDGKIFVYPLEHAVRIRTGEKDNEAL